MKILQLISSIGFFGAENVIIELSKELRSAKYKPYLGIIGNSQNSHIAVAREAKKNDLEVRIFHCNGKFNMRALLEIRKYIRENEINIIHSHGYKSNFYGLLASFSMNVKRITTCHNWLGHSLKMKFYENLDKLLLRGFDKIVAVSEALREEIIRSGVPKEKLEVIYNGIGIERFQDNKPQAHQPLLKKSFGIAENDMIVGIVARLIPEKGHIHLLRAFKEVISKVPNTKLLIVGDGPLKNELQAEICELKVRNNVIFTGIRNNIPELLDIMDVFVLPSFKEGMPMALLEAMAARKPVIATKVGAISEVISDNNTGLLVETKNVCQLSEAILRFFQDKEKARILGNNAYYKVKTEFSATKMAESYTKLYNSL